MVIKPDDINTDKHFFAFGDMETQISAEWIVRFFKHRKRSWSQGFTFDELNLFYKTSRNYFHSNFTFNHLKGKYVFEEQGRYYVTDRFITNCYTSTC